MRVISIHAITAYSAIKGSPVNRGKFPQIDDYGSEMNKSFVAFEKLLIPD